MLFPIIGIALISVAICIILQKTNPEFSMLISLIAGVIIFGIIIANFSPIFDIVNKWMDEFNLNNIYITTVMKALGVCYLTQLAYETCKDSGYSAIAGKVELAGKVTIILLSLPMFISLLELIKKLVYLSG